MRTHENLPASKGDVIQVRGLGNAPGSGGVISTVTVTDDRATGTGTVRGGYECRDATPAEIQAAVKDGKLKTVYG